MWEKTKAPLSENGASMLTQLTQLSTIGISHVLPNDVEPPRFAVVQRQITALPWCTSRLHKMALTTPRLVVELADANWQMDELEAQK